MTLLSKYRKGGILPLSAAAVAIWMNAPFAANAQDSAGAEDLTPIAKSLTAQDPELAQLRKIRDYLRSHPDDLRSTIWAARKYVAKGKQHSDARYFGYAEALIKPWLDKEDVHPAVLLVMADIQQYQHAFDDALSLLRRVQSRTLEGVSATLMRSNLHQVMGAYEDAIRNCRLLESDLNLMANICELSLLSLTGDLESSHEQLRNLLDRAQLPPEIKAWAVGKLADMLIRRGRPMEALDYLQNVDQGLASAAMQTQLHDLLMTLERPNAVLTLISADEKSASLQLRRLRALKMIGENWRGPMSQRLLSMISDDRSDGPNPHARELAYFHLYLTEDFRAAFAAAQSNWAQQKEPIDTRLLFETAHQAGSLEELGNAIAWVLKNQYQDETLASYLQGDGSPQQEQS